MLHIQVLHSSIYFTKIQIGCVQVHALPRWPNVDKFATQATAWRPSEPLENFVKRVGMLQTCFTNFDNNPSFDSLTLLLHSQ